MIFNKIGQKAYRVGLLTCGIMSVAGCVKQPTKYDLIVNEINALIPQRPVSVVADYRTGDCRGYYSTSSHQVVIEGGVRANGPDTIVHEMGHAVFRVLTHFDPRTGRSQDELWRKIYAFSLTANNFELVRDSRYRGELKICYGRIERNKIGHPWENESELFASSFMVYRQYPDEFVEKITARDASRENRAFGRLVFVYLRDKVFNGRTFSKTDPFKHDKID